MLWGAVENYVEIARLYAQLMLNTAVDFRNPQ